MAKRCSTCGGDGPFHRNRSTPDGFAGECKSCKNLAKKARLSDPEKRAAYFARQRELRDNNPHYWKRENERKRLAPEEKKAVWRENARKWRAKNPSMYLLYAAKQRAKKLSLPFSITVADVVIPERCPVLGIPLVQGKGCGPTDPSPSLDRIVPELGYVPGNVCVISIRANTIKSNATLEELLAVAEYVRKAKRSG